MESKTKEKLYPVYTQATHTHTQTHGCFHVALPEIWEMSVSVRSQQSRGGCHRETRLSWIVNTAWFTSVATPHRTPQVHTYTGKQRETHTRSSTSLLLLFFPCWSQDSPSGRVLTVYRKGNPGLHLGTTQWHTYTSSSLTNRHTLLTNRNTQPLFPPVSLLFS